MLTESEELGTDVRTVSVQTDESFGVVQVIQVTKVDKRSMKKKNNQIRHLKRINYQLRLKCRSLEAKLKRSISEQKRKQEKIGSTHNLNRLDPGFRTLVQEQVRAARVMPQGMRWSTSTIEMAQCLLYKSPACYAKLRTFMKLPSTSTVLARSPNVGREVIKFVYIYMYK